MIDLSDFEFERRKIDLAVPWINPCGGRFLGCGFTDFLITFDTGSHTGELQGSTLHWTINHHPEVW